MNKGDVAWVRFGDEATRIGSGVRKIEILSKGPKWVRLLSPNTGVRQRISRKRFDSLKPIEIWND